MILFVNLPAAALHQLLYERFSVGRHAWPCDRGRCDTKQVVQRLRRLLDGLNHAMSGRDRESAWPEKRSNQS